MDLIIYHDNCMDGFAAAWIAKKKYPEAAIHAANYGEPAPIVEGLDVLIVDFSYPRMQLLQMERDAQSLRVFDHHKTAAADLEGLDFCVFDMERSGAGITWDELFPEQGEGPGARPWIVNYIEDRDLWRWRLSKSKEVNAYLSTVAKTIDAFNHVQRHVGLGEAIDRGASIRTRIDLYVAAMSEHAQYFAILGLGVGVPVINALPWDISELLGSLASGNDSGVAMGWFVRGDGKVQCSLRSRGDTDVSEFAKSKGGGGHAKAAGFELKDVFALAAILRP